MSAEEKIKKLKEFLSYLFDTYTEDDVISKAVRSVARRVQKIIADDEVETEESP